MNNKVVLSEDAKRHFESYINLINVTLDDYLSVRGLPYQIVADACKYSVENGGKRLRPIIVLEFCKLCKGNIADAISFACALEMIHTYSLIHDDLPCMDNDIFRRGQESCHKKFGEDYALLAGDALLTYAFQIASNAGVPPAKTVRCIRALANYAGIFGMIGGQTLDIQNEGRKDLTLEELAETHRLKTGALFRAAAEIGCITGNATCQQYDAARIFAENIGIAFQIIDDVLDVIGNPEELGKEVGQDIENDKVTYVTLLGVEGAKKLAEKHTEKAIKALKTFENAELAIEGTKYLLGRTF
ncbi:MAG: polyprenyl synthetase family protein [Ruminococcaceae bacterium]|nr:polyprenyl synthetase family protein [Oscillospiraceae bacterium]